jgi:hypothetical protein
MSLARDESVPLRLVRHCGINLQDAAEVKHRQNVRSRKISSRMAQLRVVCHGHCPESDFIGKAA